MRRVSSLSISLAAILATLGLAVLTTAAVVNPPVKSVDDNAGCAASCTADHAAGASCSVSGSCTSATSAANNCADFGACSLHADLMKADDEKLASYAMEKDRDGERFEDLALVSFEAKDLEGSQVSSKDLVGHPTLVAFLAAHCGHCAVSLPMLSELQVDYADAGLKVVGVYVNSGDSADVRRTTATYAPKFTIWTHPETDIGESIDSHLVPTYLLVDASGQVQQKFVGFKTRDELEKGLGDALGLASSDMRVGMKQ